MEEAKFSINVRFNLRGFDSQITVRSDTSSGTVLAEFQSALALLETLGAVPERRWENGKGNGKARPVKAEEKAKPQVQPAPAAQPGKPAQAEKAEEKPKAQAKPQVQPAQASQSAPHPVPKPGNGKIQKAEVPVCPKHGVSAQSKWAGLYCPTKLPDGSWCDWRSE